MPAKILVADDDSDVLFMTAFALRQLGGYEVWEANDGHQALELALAHTPDCLVLDVKMPGLSGYEVCLELRGREGWASTPILMLSARGQVSEIEEGYAAGADLYMLKPYAPQHLLDEVGRLLAATDPQPPLAAHV